MSSPLRPTDAWKRYWGFSRTPFAKQLAPSEILAHPGHKEAVARIRFVTDEATIGLITGEVGAGKTVAVRAAVHTLDPTAHTVIYLSNPLIGARGIHHHLVTELGHTPRFHRPALIAQTNELLARQRDERDKQTLLVVDEAHLCDPDQLEQLRLTTSLNMDSESQLALLLVGQPTLRRTLRHSGFAALDQRIAVRYHIDPLDPEHAADYLTHHLALAGRTDAIFANDAATAITHAARGLPRQIGNLATAALIGAYTRNSRIVDHDCAQSAIADHTDT